MENKNSGFQKQTRRPFPRVRQKFYGLLVGACWLQACSYTSYQHFQTDVPLARPLQKDTLALGYVEGSRLNLSQHLTGYLESMLSHCQNLYCLPARQTDSLMQSRGHYGFPRGEYSPLFLAELQKILPYRYFLRSTLLDWHQVNLEEHHPQNARVSLRLQLYDLQTAQVIWQCEGIEEGSVSEAGEEGPGLIVARKAEAQFPYLLRDMFAQESNRGFCHWVGPKR
ncbi:MAG: hypothetical protein OHK0053_23530 [Microscillaceae bacterium]